MPEQLSVSGMTNEFDESSLEWTKQALGETTASSVGKTGPPSYGSFARRRSRSSSARPKWSWSPALAQMLISRLSRRPTWPRTGVRKSWTRARQNLEREVGFAMSRANFWQVYAVRPQPRAVVRNRAWKTRAHVTTRLARHSARAQALLQSLEGVVYGPDGTPLSDALVNLPSIHRSTRTGRYGEFKFEAVPRLGVKQLIVQAHGKELVIDVRSVLWPLAIHFRIDQ